MKVFTNRQLVAGLVPKDGAQLEAVELLRQGLRPCIRGHGAVFQAAALIGSSARGEANPTSDMDVLVLLDDGFKFKESRQWLSHVFSRLRADISQRLLVPLEFHAVLMSQMAPGQKRYDKQFLSHAVGVLEHGGLLCGNAEAVVHFHDLAPRLELATALTYIDRKVAKAHTALCTLHSLDEDEWSRFLADLVGAPFHALRRAFTLGGVEYVDNRSGLINSARDNGDLMIEEHLRFLRKVTERYVQYAVSMRDRQPGVLNPFVDYGVERIADEFFAAMSHIRERACAVGTV